MRAVHCGNFSCLQYDFSMFSSISVIYHLSWHKQAPFLFKLLQSGVFSIQRLSPLMDIFDMPFGQEPRIPFSFCQPTAPSMGTSERWWEYWCWFRYRCWRLGTDSCPQHSSGITAGHSKHIPENPPMSQVGCRSDCSIQFALEVRSRNECWTEIGSAGCWELQLKVVVFFSLREKPSLEYKKQRAGRNVWGTMVRLISLFSSVLF